MSSSVCAHASDCDLESLVFVRTASQRSSECQEEDDEADEIPGDPIFQTIPTIVIHPPEEDVCEVSRQYTFDDRDVSVVDDASTIRITSSRNIVVSQAANDVEECERKYSFDYWDAPLKDVVPAVNVQQDLG